MVRNSYILICFSTKWLIKQGFRKDKYKVNMPVVLRNTLK